MKRFMFKMILGVGVGVNPAGVEKYVEKLFDFVPFSGLLDSKKEVIMKCHCGADVHIIHRGSWTIFVCICYTSYHHLLFIVRTKPD